MRSLLVLCAVLVGGGLMMQRVAERITPAPSANAAVPLPAPPAAATTGNSGLRMVVIPKDRRGHFQTSGRVQGQAVSFMVDTGATVVALRSSDAAKAGLRISPADFTASVSTANGVTRAARARLTNVEIGDLRVYDVDALVLPDSALSENLLGLSFLSRIRRFEMSINRMVLEQ